MSQVTNRSGSPNKRKVEQGTNEAAQKAKQAQMKRKVKEPTLFSQYSYQLVIGGFVFVCIVSIIAIMGSSSQKINQSPVNDELEFSAHNTRGGSYTIGRVNFFDQKIISDVKDTLNVTLTTRTQLHQCPSLQSSPILPEKFDFRKEYPNCDQTLQQQGNVTSIQVLAALKTASDRFCKQTQGEFKESFSAQPIITCDKKVYQKGTVSRVFDYGKKQGFVTDGCFPYDKDSTNDANCQKKITNCAHSRKTLLGYCITTNEDGIKKEIYQNGPVTVAIPLFRNFLNYKSGIFRVTEGSPRIRAGVTLNIIGWDITAEGEKYWIVENFWGESWGQNGIGHVAIGIADLFIDQYALAPIPNIEANRKEMEEQQRQMQQQQGGDDTVQTDLD